MGRKLGDPEYPLLVSVRSGARFSMPGMMETVLNIGLNDASVAGLARHAGDDRLRVGLLPSADPDVRQDRARSRRRRVRACTRPDEGQRRRRDRRRTSRRFAAATGRRLQVDHPRGHRARVPAGSVPATRSRDPLGVPVVEHRPRAAVPAPGAHPAHARHRRQRAGDGVRQRGQGLGDRSRVHSRSEFWGLGRVRRLPARCAGRGRRCRHPQRAAAAGARAARP